MLIKNFDNYSVSREGFISNVKTGRVLKGVENMHGYLTVRIKNNDGRFVTKTVHRLVAETYLDALEPNLVVDHIDGNKHNNSVDNLEFVTSRENTKRAYDMGLIPIPVNGSESSKKGVSVTKISDGSTRNFSSISDGMKYLGYSAIPGSWTRRGSDTVVLRGHEVRLLG